jgi:type I restriction enzyme, S subunit
MSGTTVLGELMSAKKTSLDPRKTPEREFELFSIPAFDSGEAEVVKGSDIGSTKQVVENGDVLLSKIVPHIRRAWVVDQASDRPTIGSSEWIIFRSDRFDPHYLRHVLTSDRFHQAFMQTVAGIGGSLLRARPAYVADIEVPLPPLGEQKRIASILDAVDTLRTKRQQAIDQLETLTQATFIDLVGDPGSPDLRWPLVALDSVVGAPITRGIDQPGPDAIDGVPYLKTTDLGKGNIRREELMRSTPEIAEKFPRSVVKQGDVVICIRATVGPTLLIGEELVGVNLSRGTARVSPSGKILPRFLYACMRSDNFGYQLERKLRGATFLQIPLGELKKIEIPLPPVEFQQRVVDAIQQVDRSLSAGREHLAQLGSLFSSVQQRAFRGDL